MNIRPYRDVRPVIGKRVWIDPAAVVIGRVTIGDDASIWPGAVLRGDVNYIEIGARCLVGMGAIVMDGTIVGDEVIVGAGSLVPAGRKLAPRTLWLGSPAREARALRADEIAMLAESAAHYVALKDDYLKRG
jgi:carbonic anhydrase/acetyltransferase-like protein (isoleucine patch superfamily)